jgi:hypothetical protein
MALKWLAISIGGSSLLLAACDECKDSQVGKIWCEGAVRIECRAKAGAETVHHNVRVVFDDCGARGLACIQSGRDSWCGFSEVSCEDKPEEFCEDNWRVSCAGGRAHPAAVENCESGSPGEKYCVERADDAICSGFDDHCSAGEPPRCINSSQFECIQGAWEVVSAKVCPQTDAASP